MCLCTKVKTTSSVFPQELYSSVFETWSLTQVNFCVSQGSTCLCLSRPGITRVCMPLPLAFSCGFWGLNSGLHACKSITYTVNYLSPSICFQFSNQTLENTSILFILYTKPCLSPWFSDASPGLSTWATISLTSVPSTFSPTQLKPFGLLAGYQANLVFSFNPLWPHLESSLSLSRC